MFDEFAFLSDCVLAESLARVSLICRILYAQDTSFCPNKHTEACKRAAKWQEKKKSLVFTCLMIQTWSGQSCVYYVYFSFLQYGSVLSTGNPWSERWKLPNLSWMFNVSWPQSVKTFGRTCQVKPTLELWNMIGKILLLGHICSDIMTPKTTDFLGNKLFKVFDFAYLYSTCIKQCF